MAKLLDPIRVAVFPRFSEAVGVVGEMAQSWTSDGFSIALPTDQTQAESFRTSWPEDHRHPLLLLHCTSEESIAIGVTAIADIMTRNPTRPLAVFLADGPEVSGFKEGNAKAWNRGFSRALADEILDVQVFEYTPTWAHAPPRVH